MRLSTYMRGSNHIFDCVHLYYFKYHKKILNEVDHTYIKTKKQHKILLIKKIINAVNML